MTGIFPDTEVRLISGCPIEKSHGNTIFFTSLNEQVQYFARFPQRVFYNVSYQRENRNVLRIECPIAEVINCNYMMFKNESFENKWFYAFIDKINYVNPKTTEVEYEIDVLQSWYFNFDFHQSFVEREHTLSDKVGENIISEPFSISEYTNNSKIDISPYTNNAKKFTAIIYYVPNLWLLDSYTVSYIESETLGTENAKISLMGKRCEGVDNQQQGGVDWYYNFSARKGGLLNNIYEGFNTVTCEIDTTNATTLAHSEQVISLLIDRIITAPSYTPSTFDYTPVPIDAIGGKIVAISIVPTNLANIENYQREYILNEPASFTDPNNIFNTYTPKNNKLYCYPYQKITLSNNDGSLKTLYWENSSQNANGRKSLYINLEGALYPNPALGAYPENYNGLLYAYENGLTLDAFVDCTWSEDSFTKWYNVNRAKISTTLLTNALMIANGAVAAKSGASKFGNQMMYYGASGVVNTFASMEDKKYVPDEMYGNISGDGLKMLQNRYLFYAYLQQIKAPQAKVIDDFFTMYGYQVNELKIPNVFNPSVFSNLRPCWNYVKTQNAVITPKEGLGLPAEAEQKICEIFNNGVTFWNKDASVGDYSQNNAPVV